MSASQDKKRRTDERALGTERRQVASQKEAKERKQSKIKWTVGSIIVVLLVAAILIGNSSLFYTARPALQVFFGGGQLCLPLRLPHVLQPVRQLSELRWPRHQQGAR